MLENEAEREVMALTLTTNAELLAGILRGTDRPDDAVIAALGATRSLGLILEDIVRSLVVQARAEGRSWAEVGEALNVTRQASFQRFGGTEAPESIGGGASEPLPEAGERAVELLEQFLREAWDGLRSTFDDTMLQRCSVDLLASVRRKVAEDIGDFDTYGDPAIAVVAGYTVVNVPMTFQLGDRLGRVAFNGYGQVSGFFLLPPDARVMPTTGRVPEPSEA
jgi:hypothetical protein